MPYGLFLSGLRANAVEVESKNGLFGFGSFGLGENDCRGLGVSGCGISGFVLNQCAGVLCLVLGYEILITQQDFTVYLEVLTVGLTNEVTLCRRRAEFQSTSLSCTINSYFCFSIFAAHC